MNKVKFVFPSRLKSEMSICEWNNFNLKGDLMNIQLTKIFNTQALIGLLLIAPAGFFISLALSKYLIGIDYFFDLFDSFHLHPLLASSIAVRMNRS